MCSGLLVTLVLLNPAAPVPKDPSPLRRLNEEKRATARELLRLSREAMANARTRNPERVEADMAAAAQAVRDANVALGADPMAAREAYRKECRATEQTLAGLVEKGLIRPSLLWWATIRTLEAEIDLTAGPGVVASLRRTKRDLAGKGGEVAEGGIMGCECPGGLLGHRLDYRDFAAAAQDADLADATNAGQRAAAREAYRKWWERTNAIAQASLDVGVLVRHTSLQVTALWLDAEINAAKRPEDRRGLREMKLSVVLEAARIGDQPPPHLWYWRDHVAFPVGGPAVTVRDTELALQSKVADRVAACERCVAVRRVAADRMAEFATGAAPAADYLRVRLARLDAEIRLVEEGGRPALTPPGGPGHTICP